MGSRINNMKKEIPIDLDNFRMIRPRGLGLQLDLHANIIIDLIKESGEAFDVIIFDPLYKLCHGGDLNDNKTATNWTGNVDKILSLNNSTGIIVRHDSEKVKIDDKGGRHGASIESFFGSSILSTLPVQLVAVLLSFKSPP